jgi:hypothetical protein
MPLNYLDLIGPKTTAGSLLNFVNYRKVPVEVVVEEAQALIFQRLRVREMKSDLTLVTLPAGQSSVALPAGFLEAITMRDREGMNMIPDRFVSDDELARHYVYENDVLISSVPTRVAVFGEKLQFECRADSARKYDLVYYKTPELLSANNKTNFLTSRYPHILRTACQAGAANFMKDTEEFTARYAEMTGYCNDANAESDLGRAA